MFFRFLVEKPIKSSQNAVSLSWYIYKTGNFLGGTGLLTMEPTIQGIILALFPTDDLILNSSVEEDLIGSNIQDFLSVATARKQWKN